jgi:hypothetical protein
VFDQVHRILLAKLNAANRIDWSRAAMDGRHIDAENNGVYPPEIGTTVLTHVLSALTTTGHRRHTTLSTSTATSIRRRTEQQPSLGSLSLEGGSQWMHAINGMSVAVKPNEERARPPLAQHYRNFGIELEQP